MSETSIYLDNQGNYRDRTDENLEKYPPLEADAESSLGDVDAPEASADAADDGTLSEAGEDTDPGATPEPPGSAPAPKTPKGK